MALARFKDICVDSNDPAAAARFWSPVLDLPAEPSGEDTVIRGATPGHTVWFNRVPEPKTVKNRVHLDIYARSLGELEALGARVVDAHCGQGKWTVMADPEGSEFCAFLRPELPPDRLHGLVVDSADPVAIAEWWGGVYGADIDYHDRRWATVHRVPGMYIETMDFVPVPEPKTVKNRLHWDVTVDDLDALVRAGATILAPAGPRPWTVMADPEGNEFCAFPGT
ncbi:MAG TPA: VOC family protein [Acidimicrobiales bacterium]|nr:VOC family protein [Acidimicrobiales bacterium]